MTIWRTLRCCPSDWVRCSRFCFTFFSCPEYVLTAYQRNIGWVLLDDLLDESGEDRVEQPEVAAGDQDEHQDDARHLRQLLAVGPLDALELGPDRDEECDQSIAVALLCRRPSAPHSARARRGGLLDGLLLVLEVVVLELLEVLRVSLLQRRVLEGLVG